MIFRITMGAIIMVERLEDLSKEELIKRVRLSAEMSVAVDGIWFMAVEEA